MAFRLDRPIPGDVRYVAYSFWMGDRVTHHVEVAVPLMNDSACSPKRTLGAAR